MELHDILLAPDVPTSSAFLLNLIGGLFGRKDAKKRDAAAAEAAKVPVVTSHQTDLPKMVKEAQAAGFNPMTILNAGGLSAYTTTSTTGQNAMAAVPTAPSVGSVIAGAAIQTMDQIGSFLSAGGMSRSFASPSIPAVVGGVASGGALSRGGSGRMASAAVLGANPYGFEKVPAQQMNSMPALLPRGGDPSLASTDSVEQDYGDLLSWVYGVGKLYSDIVYNVTGSSIQDRRAALDAAPKTVPQQIGAGLGTAIVKAGNAYDYAKNWLNSSASGVYVDPSSPLSPAGGYDTLFPKK